MRDLETVDKPKEDITQLKDKVLKAEERSRTTSPKNEGLIEQYYESGKIIRMNTKKCRIKLSLENSLQNS